MDQILRGIFESTHPEKFKKLLFAKVAEAHRINTDKDVVSKLLDECLVYLHQGPTFNSDMAKIVFEKWALSNPIDSYNCVEKLLDELKLEENDKIKTLETYQRSLWLIQYILIVMKDCDMNESSTGVDSLKTVEKEETAQSIKKRIMDRLVNLYLTTEELCALEHISITGAEHWEHFLEAILRLSATSEFCDKALTALNKVEIPLPSASESFSKPQILERVHKHYENCTKEINQANSIATLIGKFLQTHKDHYEFVLNKMFSLLASETTLPGLGLAAILQHLTPALIENAMLAVSRDSRIKDNNLFLVLNRMIGWLWWPGTTTIDIWVVQLMKALFSSGRTEIVFKTIELQVIEVTKHLFYTVSQHQALTILSSMVLCYQHSPGVFHRVLSRMVLFVKCLQLDVTSRETAQVVADLMYSMMHHFPGHLKKYSEAVDILKEYVRPTEDKMKRWLAECANLKDAQDFAVPQIPEKSPSQKTGLQNLGNTCYINSVIQALFMLKSFRQEVLQRKWLGHSQPLSLSLQALFSALLATKRLAVNPRQFVDVSRPPWFNKGSQQDCSEFLKYMLDRLEEEDQHCPPVTCALHRQFVGECRIQTRCSHCGTTSSRTEAFNDLPLSFPVAEHPNATEDGDRGTPTLKGGELLRNQANSYHSSGKARDRSGSDYDRPEGHSSWMSSHDNFDKGTRPLTSDSETQTSNEVPLQLQDMISSCLSREILSGANQYKCDACQMLCDAERQLYLTKLPKYLVLTLKRFTYNAKVKIRTKIMTEVKCPLILEIPETTIPNLSCPGNSLPLAKENKKQYFEGQGNNSSSEMEVDHSMRTDNPSVSLDSIGQCSDGSSSSSTLTAGPSSSIWPQSSNLPSEAYQDGHTTAYSTKDLTAPPVESSLLEEQKVRNASFMLSAVVVHSGTSSDSGHYYCFCREGSDSSLSRESLNDSKKYLLEDESGLSALNRGRPQSPSTFSDSSSEPSKSEDIVEGDEKKVDNEGVHLPRKRMPDDKLCNAVQWILFNDSHTTRRDFDSIATLNARHPNDTPYVLIYENMSADSFVYSKEVESREDLHEHLQSLLEADDRHYAQELGTQRRRNNSKASSTGKSPWKDNNDQDKGGPSSGCGGSIGPGLNTNGGRFIF